MLHKTISRTEGQPLQAPVEEQEVERMVASNNSRASSMLGSVLPINVIKELLNDCRRNLSNE